MKKISILKSFCLLGFPVVFLSQGCSLAPGMKVSDSLLDRNVLNTTLDTPILYKTKTGLTVKFQNLHANSIPMVKQVSSVRKKDIDYLLRYPVNQKDYVIGVGDSLALSLWAYKDIWNVSTAVSAENVNDANASNTFTVSQTGYIYLPMVGKVKASGKTEEQLRDHIRPKLSKYLKHPDVNLKVVNYKNKNFSVVGSVNKPGLISISGNSSTLMSALGKADGFSEDSDRNSISIIRNGKKYNFGLSDLVKLGISSNEIAVLDGDTISVGSYDGRQVYVFGEVTRPRKMVIPQNGMTLSNAIGESGGLRSQTASSAKVYVVRDSNYTKITNIYRLDLSSIENLALANRFEMHPNDIVYVDETGLNRWNRVINQILPSVNFYRTGQSFGIIK